MLVSIAHCCARIGHDVDLYALSGLSLQSLERVHGVNLHDQTGRISTHFVIDRESVPNGSGGLTNTYPALFALWGYKSILRKVLNKGNYDLIIFNDDIPKDVIGKGFTPTSMQYVHFPYAAMASGLVDELLEEYQGSKSKNLPGGSGYSRMSRFLVGQDSLSGNLVLANSSVTADYIRRVSSSAKPIVLPPSVNLKGLDEQASKVNDVIAVGAFRPNKRFGDLLEAFSKVRNKESTLHIFGLSDWADYLHYLEVKARKLGLERRVSLISDASREEVISGLNRTRTFVSAAQFEPFGISTVEALAAGCDPIAFRGRTSGPWLDTLSKGEFGRGFQTIQELTEALDDSLSGKRVASVNVGRARATVYDNSHFEERLVLILGQML